MTKTPMMTAVSAAGALIVSVAAAESWIIPGRTVPPPAASAALRDSILRTPAPDVTAAVRNSPRSRAEWESAIARRDKLQAARAATLARELSVSVERDKIEGVVVRRLTPASPDPRHGGRLFVHIHGGAYVFNRGDAGALEAIILADRLRMQVLSIDYRMPPEHPFPQALNDVVAVYAGLVKDRPAKALALGGTSAGAGLALSSTRRLLQLGLEPPGALFAGTPWSDLSKTGDSYFINEGLDRWLVSYDGLLEGAAKLYAAGRDLRHPLISPVYADFTGFPPTFLVAGTRDLFLSNTVRTHARLRAAGAVADLHVYEGHAHGDYLAVIESAETRQLYADLNEFLLEHLRSAR